jgi:hypothetical protein
VPEARGFVAPLLLVGGMTFVAWRGWKRENYAMVALGVLVVLLALIGTLAIRPQTAQMLIVFGGDAMGMVLAAALMTTFFYGKDTQLYRGGLRWGFLAIGAASFVDMFATWVAARRDHGRIPFGEQEGGMLSDATRLVDEHDWTPDQLVRRFLAVGICCLVALAAAYAWGVWRARRELT